MSLAALQTAFQAAILNDAQAMPASILPSRQQAAPERFAIYQEAYRLRLTSFLAQDYPVLHEVLGDDDFAALAEAYIAATPSMHRNARWYARDLPDFMRTHATWQERRAAGLASFERALADAFDAVDADVIEAAALADFAAEDQPRLRFTFQPSLTLLSLVHGIAAAHEAVSGGLAMPPPFASGEENVLIWRGRAQQALYRVLSDDEALALDSARAGGTFAEICGLLSLRLSEEMVATQAALFLVGWFGDGLIAGLTLDERL